MTRMPSTHQQRVPWPDELGLPVPPVVPPAPAPSGRRAAARSKAPSEATSEATSKGSAKTSRTSSSPAVRQRPQVAPPSDLPVLLMLLVPVLITLERIPGVPGADGLTALLDLGTLPADLRAHVVQVLFVPLGALVVVVGRLVLGLRPLGALSPILIAMALPVTGVLPGLGFVCFTLLMTTVMVRPLLKSHGLPYSARVAALLCAVVILMLLPLVVLRGFGASAPAFAYFPVVALGLVTERFAATLRSNGTSVAVGRTAVSLAEAVLIAALATHGGTDLLLHRPELLVAQMALVILVSRHLSWRLWERGRTLLRERAGSARHADSPAAPAAGPSGRTTSR